MNMNLQLQEHNIREVLKLKGIDADLIDVKALLDSSLDYSENYKLILEYINEDIHKQGKKEKKALNALSGEYSQAEGMKTNTSLSELFKTHNVIGVAGNRNTGKTMLILSQLIELKKTHPKTRVYVFGIEENLKKVLKSHGIEWLYSKQDILDLKIKNSVVFIDEIGNFFSTQTKDHQTEQFKRFIQRVSHLNDFVIMSTAEVGWWNKTACSLVNCFIVKKAEFDLFVNSTWLKRLVMGLETTSQYRLDLDINEYFILSEGLTEKHTSDYVAELDSKRDLINPFNEVK